MYQLVDLSHELHADIPVYPGTPAPSFEPVTSIDQEGFKEYYMHLTNHAGTHMDFPAHVLKKGKTITDFPVNHFAGQGAMVDCRHTSEITVEMLKPALSGGTEILLLLTGWDRYWMQQAYFEGFPVLTAQAASFIARMKPKAIGSDMISFDKVGDEKLPNHKTLLQHDILLIENLTNLEKILDRSFDVMFFPLPVRNADASPIRAVAHLKPNLA